MIKNQTNSYDVIIVNYQGEKIISNCLDSVYSCTHPPKRIIIYDNNSTDTSLDIIKNKYPKVILIEGDTNIGFGRANNAAMAYSDSKYILFVNNDVILDKKCPGELLKNIMDKDLAIINPLILKGWKKEKKQEVYAFGAEINNSGFAYGLYDSKKDRTDINNFSAACCMIRSDIIKKIQFEKMFFLYYEEPMISIGILKEKLKIGRVSSALCYHLENYSSPKKKNDGIAFRQFYGIQNRWYMIGRHWPIKLLPKAIFINTTHLIYVIYFLISTNNFSYLSILYLAPHKFILGLKLRSGKQVKDKLWYLKLLNSSVVSYFKLGKKVFS